MAREIDFEVIDVIGIISEGSKGWRKALTRVSWNGSDPKYDLRSWDAHYEKAGKGVTLGVEELRELKKLLDEEIAIIDSEDAE